jgi:hypothetical protein
MQYIVAVILYALSFIVCCVQSLIYLCTETGEYPMVKRIQEEKAIVYNGEKYFYLDEEELGVEILIQGEMTPTASIYAPYMGIFPGFMQLRVSELDTEKNLLTYDSGTLFVREDFRAIAEYDTQIISSVLVGAPASDDSKTVLGLGEGLTYRDIMEVEKTTLYIDYSEMHRAHCYFDVAEYEYWLFGGFRMIECDGVMYLSMLQERGEATDNGYYVNDCYQVKAEYQEAFKTALEDYTSQRIEAV